MEHHCHQDDETTTETVAATAYKDYAVELAYVRIYGVCWSYGNSSTACTRLLRASDPNALVNVDIATSPSPAVGGGSGSSPFDACMPGAGWRNTTSHPARSARNSEKAASVARTPTSWSLSRNFITGSSTMQAGRIAISTSPTRKREALRSTPALADTSVATIPDQAMFRSPDGLRW